MRHPFVLIRVRRKEHKVGGLKAEFVILGAVEEGFGQRNQLDLLCRRLFRRQQFLH